MKATDSIETSANGTRKDLVSEKEEIKWLTLMMLQKKK